MTTIHRREFLNRSKKTGLVGIYTDLPVMINALTADAPAPAPGSPPVVSTDIPESFDVAASTDAAGWAGLPRPWKIAFIVLAALTLLSSFSCCMLSLALAGTA